VLAVLAEDERVLHAHHKASGLPKVRQHAREGVDRLHVPPPDGRHLDYLPLHQLHAVVLTEDARLAHLVELLDGEAVLCDLRFQHLLDHLLAFRPQPTNSAVLTPRASASLRTVRPWALLRRVYTRGKKPGRSAVILVRGSPGGVQENGAGYVPEDVEPVALRN
jgi:hypothetical protein